MNENIEILVEKLEKLASINSVVDVYKPIGLCALDIICGKSHNLTPTTNINSWSVNYIF